MATSKNKHRGDSLAKRIARLEFYLRAWAHMGEERFVKSRFCYLASFEGGDASVLAALGVPPSNQLAVDFDASALVRFRERHPRISTFCGPVENAKGPFDCMFLDFCANLSDATIRSCVKATENLSEKTGSVFAFAIQRGRETGWKKRIEAATATMLEKGKSISRSFGMEPFHDDRDSAMRRQADGRSFIIYDAISDELVKRRIGLLTFARLMYRSVDPEELATGKPGTPMLIAGYHSVTPSTPTSEKEFRRWMGGAAKLNSEFIHEWDRILAACSFDREYEFRWKWPPAAKERLWRFAALDGGCHLDMVGFESRATLCRMIVKCDDLGIDPALALNLKPATVAALRAHATRGTYREQDERERKRGVENAAQQAIRLGTFGPGEIITQSVDDTDASLVAFLRKAMGVEDVESLPDFPSLLQRVKDLRARAIAKGEDPVTLQLMARIG